VAGYTDYVSPNEVVQCEVCRYAEYVYWEGFRMVLFVSTWELVVKCQWCGWIFTARDFRRLSCPDCGVDRSVIDRSGGLK